MFWASAVQLQHLHGQQAQHVLLQVVDAVAGGRTIHPNVVTAMCGVTKLYVGEIVELARAIATRGGHHGALLPTHVYQAYHALEEVQPSPTKKARLFR
jgi:hTAFII28-like protein conserved region